LDEIWNNVSHVFGADHGRFLARSAQWRRFDKEPKFFYDANNAIFRRFPVGKKFTTFQHNKVNRCRHVNFQNIILKILPQGVVFLKNAKIAKKVLGLATSGRQPTPQRLQMPKTHGQLK